MPGNFRGQRIGACTDCRNNWAAYRAQEIDIEEVSALNEELAPTAGTCGVMGTASTMACLTAALGLLDLKAGAYVKIKVDYLLDSLTPFSPSLLPSLSLFRAGWSLEKAMFN